MKVFFLCMANESTVEIVRGYTSEQMARRAMKGHPSSDTVKWGVLPLVMLTADELAEAEKVVEMSDAHVEDGELSLGGAA
jgi:hypothetical protein